jgi:hypothetical protein
MAASIWNVYDQALLEFGEALIDLTSGTYKIALFASTSNVGLNNMSPATYAAATNELPTANGYTIGGQTVTQTWTNSSGVETLGSTGTTWTPSGPGIIARWAVLYNSSTGKLICWSLLNTAPSDVSVTQITISGSGVFQLQRAA